MKKIFLRYTIFLSIMFLANLTFAQDMIILKTGDEIKSKVLEITPDLVKYKKWENQEGPAYSANKSDIFMIKYSNGTKDVFNIVPAVNSNTNQISPITSGSKFLGTWYYKKYNGNGNRTLINITKAVDNFLVEYKVYEDVGNNLYSADGSFKEVGHLENGSIVINSFTKLSLLSENTLLMNSAEFWRPNENLQNQNTSIIKKIEPIYAGGLKNGKKEGNGKQIYEKGSIYDGEWKNDKRNGYGTYLGSDGSKYVGYWKNDMRDSTCTMQYSAENEFPKLIFVGTFKDDAPYNGILTSTNSNYQVIETIVKNGVRGFPKVVGRIAPKN